MTTVVTAYYTIPSKMPNEKYLIWIKYFSELPCNMIIYTDSTNYEYITECRKKYADKTVIIQKRIEDFYVYKYLEYFKWCKQIDCEKKHSVQLYMLWNEKTFMTYEASITNPFNSTYFLWTDMGCIRDPRVLKQVVKYPNEEKVKKLVPINKFVLSTMAIFKNSDYNIDQFKYAGYKLLKDFIQGGFMIGSIEMWRSWKILYEDELKFFINNKWFIGKDQYVMTSAYIRDYQRGKNDIIKLRDAKQRWISFLNEYS